jgi:hypothetical protein
MLRFFILELLGAATVGIYMDKKAAVNESVVTAGLGVCDNLECTLFILHSPDPIPNYFLSLHA